MPGIEDLKGVNKKAKNSLLEHGYDNLEKIANATKEELVALPFIGDKTAEKILALAKELTSGTVKEEKEVKKEESKAKTTKTATKTKKEQKPATTTKTTKPKKKTTSKKTKKAEKPQIVIKPNQLLGRIIAIRSSSSGIRHPSQGIVKLLDSLDIEPAILVGKKVKAKYPSGKEIRGKVIGIFGKKTNKKFIVRFNKNISGELVSSEVVAA